MIGYWSNFARSGDPNGRALPHWRPVRAGDHRPYVQSLETTAGFPGPIDLSARHHCDLWRTIAPS
jgi:para-nitrobenzyl esterase